MNYKLKSINTTSNPSRIADLIAVPGTYDENTN
jgi:hypothetical protein